MKKTVTKMKVGDLKFDDELIQLRPVNLFFVNRYSQNYRQGAAMPPVIVDKKTKKIVSGNHRAHAMQKEFEDDYEIEVIEKTYKTRRELLTDFALENARHGMPLDGISKKRITAALISEGATEEDIARLFDISSKRVRIWGTDVAVVEIGKGKQSILPIKRGPEIKHSITQAQYDDHIAMDKGTSFQRDASQITRWLSNGWVNSEAENIKVAKDLFSALEKYLAEQEVAA